MTGVVEGIVDVRERRPFHFSIFEIVFDPCQGFVSFFPTAVAIACI